MAVDRGGAASFDEMLLERFRSCLALEREAERGECDTLQESLPAKELERRGIALHRLRILSTETALFGRASITMQLSGGRPLPPTKLSPGAMVSLRPAAAAAAAASTCTVTAVRATSLTVTFEELPEEEQLAEPLTLSLLYNDVTYRRLDAALSALRNGKMPAASAPLCRALLADDTAAATVLTRGVPASAAQPLPEAQVINRGLNEGQRLAIGFALDPSRPVALIHGPPGTGKTTAVVELIRQAVARGERVLASAASNIAVDNMAERLLGGGGKPLRIVRIGHPARLLPSVLGASLDARLAVSDGAAIVRDVKDDLTKARNNLRKERSKGARGALKAEMSTLRRELAERQKRSVKELLETSQVVLCTNTGAADRALGCLPAEHAFDLVVIDEAAQALEASCWVALLRGKRAVLAGDHNQLPPVVKSEEAEKQGFGVTLFERLLRGPSGGAVGVMLTTQYRMNSQVCAWASDELYDGRLVADDSVAAHLLCGLAHVETREDTETALLFIDTAGCDCDEDKGESGSGGGGGGSGSGSGSGSAAAAKKPELSPLVAESKSNAAEARIVAEHVRALLAAGLRHDEIGVITPYNAQVEVLREELAEERKVPSASGEGYALEVGTVDGFQGREKEAIIISLVRSNAQRAVGFLSENRRMNVAITRGRRHVCLVGDSDTCSATPFLARMVDYFQENGDVRSAAQYGAEAATGRRAAQRQPAPRVEPERMTEEQAEEKLRLMLRSFLADEAQTKLALPPSVNSFERMVAHRLASELGLDHASAGEGRHRFLTLYKKGASPNGAEKAAAAPVKATEPESTAAAALPAAGAASSDGAAPTPPPPTPPAAAAAAAAAALAAAAPAHQLDARQHQLALRVRELFTQMTAGGMAPNDAAAKAMVQAQAEAASTGSVAKLMATHTQQSAAAAAAKAGSMPASKAAAKAADLRAASANAAASRSAAPAGAAAAAAAEAAAARAVAQADSNDALRQVALEREARQREVEAERQAAEAAVRQEMRREEDERRKEVTRAKKERRKQKKGDEGGDGGCPDGDDVDTALAALGIGSNGGSAAEPNANPTRPSALPWGRDREAERDRERLKAALHTKLANGDGSHKARQTKKK